MIRDFEELYDQIINENIDILDKKEEKVLINLAMLSSLVANDLKYIHFHAMGRHFDRIHDLAEKYYNDVSEMTDYFCELALEKNLNIPNLSNAYTYLKDQSRGKVYTIQKEGQYDLFDGIHSITDVLNQLTAAMIFARSRTKDSDIQSYLDDRIRYFNKEINYKLKRRSIEVKSQLN